MCLSEECYKERKKAPNWPTGPYCLLLLPPILHIAGCKRLARMNRRCKSEKWRWSSMHLPVRVRRLVLHTLLGPNLGLASISFPQHFSAQHHPHPGPCSLCPLVSSCMTRRPPAYQAQKTEIKPEQP